ncbi:uncharacterized protein CcaverHIS019_0505860 [Cutaneotrichosporon cavernicola]|uniref:DinB-like domain-containing protein n=1 Tax=Cutaneotrichosporon cavernicola TaxID=279322 RepID=A0AA48QX29_9TREE|nr:uncharacterized protein CcaverHIS019_0505860 [Cutaneotrichosporon cavernicola]BEI92958.1 hypothetical protein CcaverHIS019_0505860 [Cutaneotrichosporon cavernicola]BEJ00734.1 hypothetical protein CcaverHIS631_0505910 [Cutaneotrichosporon cavernicola]
MARSPSPTNDQRSPAIDHLSHSQTSDDPLALVHTSLSLIDSGIDLLSHLSDDGQLTHASVLIPGGSVGKHFRHVAETFDALLAALDPEYYGHTTCNHGGIPTVDYDILLPPSRGAVARDLDTCRAAMGKVRAGLEAMTEGELGREVDVLAVTPSRQCMRSTLARELWFCALHAIHHYTMIRTICVHELGIALPVEFGTAPATLLLRPRGWKPPAEVWKAKL